MDAPDDGGADPSASLASGSGLYTRRIAADGRLADEVCLDELVCECCPTDAVRLEDGTLVVVYRDRTPEELRDIWFVRQDPATLAWSEPQPVHRDEWRIEGCPVNGPAIAASGSTVAVAWFTQGGRAAQREVRVAFSTDGGRSFARPKTVVAGATLGRVDVAHAGGQRFVLSHLAAADEVDGEGQSASWDVVLVAPAAPPAEIVSVTAADPGRRSGRLELASNVGRVAGGRRGGVVAVWTGVSGLQAARIDVVPRDREAEPATPPE